MPLAHDAYINMCLLIDTVTYTCMLNRLIGCSCWITVSDYKGGALWAFVVPFAIVILVGTHTVHSSFVM